VNFKIRAKIPNRYHIDACRAHAKKKPAHFCAGFVFHYLAPPRR
jgi:hypothetical protein